MNFSASGEAEKMAWLAALSKAAGQRQSAANDTVFGSGAGRPSVRAIGKKPDLVVSAGAAQLPVAKSAAASPKPAAAAPAPSAAPAEAASPAAAAAAAGGSLAIKTAAAATQVTSAMGSAAANEKLKAKLAGGGVKLPGATGTGQTLCTVCALPVYKMEELVVDKAIMHKRCFQCTHCHRQLTLGNFAAVNKTLYCKVHYFELFSTNGGKYDKAFVRWPPALPSPPRARKH
jgi:hypothetical protein